MTIEQPDESGAMRADFEGRIVFTRDGHMAAKALTSIPTMSTARIASAGYEASYGMISPDVPNSTFVHRVEGVPASGLVGQDLPRAYSFVGDQFILTSTRDDE